jgi:hypothetical protein
MNEKVGRWSDLMRGACARHGSSARKLLHHDPTLVEMLSLSSWWRFVAETIGLVGLIIGLQALVFNGSASNGGMPHPYWIPVLLMSSQYGVLGGLFAAVTATTAYFIVDAPSPSAALDFYVYAGAVAGQPAAWLGTALILGGLRSLHIRHSRDIEEQLEEFRSLADGLSDGLESALAEIRNLEKRIAVDANTVAAVSRSLARLDATHRRAAAASFADLVRHSVGASSFGIYLKGQSGFEPACVVDGDRALPVSALPPLDSSLVGAVLKTDGVWDGAQDSPVTGERLPVIAAVARRGSDGEALGVVVCATFGLSQGVAVARRRLDDLTRAFAAIVSACGDADRGARGDE